MSIVESGPRLKPVKNVWNELENAYHCRVMLCPEEVGGYSIHAMTLPGVVSQGNSVPEAVANIRDAFREAIAVYAESGAAIPWSEVTIDDVPAGSKELWIVVNG